MEKYGVTLQEGKTVELFYAERLLQQLGILLPEGKKLRLGYSKTPANDAMMKEVKQAMSMAQQRYHYLPNADEEFEHAKQQYLSLILGS